MSITKIKANIVAVGKHGKRDLDEVNKLLMQFLKNRLADTEYGFNARWDRNSETVYTIHYPYSDKTIDLKISIFDYPLSFDNWRRTLKYSGIHESVFEDSGPKLVCSLESSLLGDKLKSARRLYNDGTEFLKLLKKSEAEIVPGRSLVLLLDNENVLFDPIQFEDYMRRNEISPGFAYDGELYKE